MPQHQGFGHLTLTVNDMERSADFYNRILGAQTIATGADDHGPYIIVAGEGFMVGLRKHAQTPAGESFDPMRVGLDHMGVHVESRAELEKWRAHLDEHGVENSGIAESPFGLHLNAKDPDRIAIEFFAPS
ncbi:MAG: VOC family protein [Acidimicrobiales bacterium]